jgi:hypothetical protein
LEADWGSTAAKARLRWPDGLEIALIASTTRRVSREGQLRAIGREHTSTLAGHFRQESGAGLLA